MDNFPISVVLGARFTPLGLLVGRTICSNRLHSFGIGVDVDVDDASICGSSGQSSPLVLTMAAEVVIDIKGFSGILILRNRPFSWSHQPSSSL